MKYECAFPFDDDTVEAILAAEDQIIYAMHQEGELYESPEHGIRGRADNFITDYKAVTSESENWPESNCRQATDYPPHKPHSNQHVLDYREHRIAVLYAPRPGEYVPVFNAHPDPDYHAVA